MLEGRQKLILAISILLGIVFWITVPFKPYPYSYILKWFPVLTLAIFAWQQQKKIGTFLPALALFCHSIGDVLLDIDRVTFLLPSLGPFFLGHVLMLLTFKKQITSLSKAIKRNAIITIAITLFAIIMAGLIIPNLKPVMLVPVVLYMIVLSVMTLFSYYANYSKFWVCAGATSYMISDAIIGISAFVTPLPGHQIVAWPTYYFGLLAIVLSLTRHYHDSKS